MYYTLHFTVIIYLGKKNKLVGEEMIKMRYQLWVYPGYVPHGKSIARKTSGNGSTIEKAKKGLFFGRCRKMPFQLSNFKESLHHRDIFPYKPE